MAGMIWQSDLNEHTPTKCPLCLSCVLQHTVCAQGKVPRASYDGTVIVRCRGRRLFITKE